MCNLVYILTEPLSVIRQATHGQIFLHGCPNIHLVFFFCVWNIQLLQYFKVHIHWVGWFQMRCWLPNLSNLLVSFFTQMYYYLTYFRYRDASSFYASRKNQHKIRNIFTIFCNQIYGLILFVSSPSSKCLFSLAWSTGRCDYRMIYRQDVDWNTTSYQELKLLSCPLLIGLNNDKLASLLCWRCCLLAVILVFIDQSWQPWYKSWSRSSTTRRDDNGARRFIPSWRHWCRSRLSCRCEFCIL